MGGQFRSFVIHFVRDTRGATAIEYSIIAAGVAVTIIGALTSFFGALGGVYGEMRRGVE